MADNDGMMKILGAGCWEFPPKLKTLFRPETGRGLPTMMICGPDVPVKARNEGKKKWKFYLNKDTSEL